jgi:hypothetical protein
MTANGGFEVGFHGEYGEIVPEERIATPRSSKACLTPAAR